MRRFIIDTDTASDDAVAIMMALASPDIVVEAITIVAGNVTVKQASINARYTLEVCNDICNTKIPVYEGCDRPWLREPARADWFHGEDGFSNQNYSQPRRAAEAEHAVTELIERFRKEPGQIELVTLGPLTNIATALSIEPNLAQWVKHCYVMGGAAATLGNITPAAEYNIWCDPESAQRVLQSGMPLTMIGWELSCNAAALDEQEIASIRALGTARAHMAIDTNKLALQALRNLQGQTGLALADPVAMAVAIEPEIVTEQAYVPVHIETTSELTRGMTVVDRNDVMGNDANANVCFAIDTDRWKALLKRSLS